MKKKIMKCSDDGNFVRYPDGITLQKCVREGAQLVTPVWDSTYREFEIISFGGDKAVVVVNGDYQSVVFEGTEAECLQRLNS